MAKVGRKAAIVPLEDQIIIKADIEKGMSYRETIADIQRKTGHRYWMEKISQIVNSPTLGGVKQPQDNRFSAAAKKLRTIEQPKIPRPSTNTPSAPLSVLATGFPYATESFLTDDALDIGDAFEGLSSVYSPPVIQPSIFDDPLRYLFGRINGMLEQKLDIAMWSAADAITDKWLGQNSTSQPTHSNPEVEELIKRANARLENSERTDKKPEIGPASPDAPAIGEKDAKIESNAPYGNECPSETAKGESDLKKQSSDEDTDLEKPGEPPKATPIAPPATLVEPNSNSASDMKPPTQPPATLATQPSESIKPSEPHLQEQPPTDLPKSEPKSIVGAPEVPIDKKAHVVQDVNAPTDKETMHERPGENLAADNPACGKQADKQETSVEPTVISEAKSTGEAKDGTSWDIIALGVFGAATILGITYLEHKKTRQAALALLNPTRVSKTKIASAAVPPKSSPTLYGVPLQNERIVF